MHGRPPLPLPRRAGPVATAQPTRPACRVDEQPVNGRVLSRELYAAISGLREEAAFAQRAQTADVRAAVAATEHRLCTRRERLEATVNQHDDLIQQLRGARSLLTLIFGASVLTAVLALLTLVGHLG